MLAIDLLGARRVLTGVHVTSKKRLLELVATALSDDSATAVEASIFDSLCSRERLGTTGLGHGVAIPHGRTTEIETAVGAFIQLAEPIDFGAVDDKPVDLLFALAVPEHFRHEHLELLSQLATMFSDESLCAALRAASDSAEVIQLLSNWQFGQTT